MKRVSSVIWLFWISAHGQIADSTPFLPEAFKKLSPVQFDEVWNAEPQFETLVFQDSGDVALWAWSMDNLAEIARATNGTIATSRQLGAVDIPSTRLKWLVHTHPIVGGAWKDGRMVYATQPYSPSPGDLKYAAEYKRRTMRIITATPVKGEIFSYSYRTDNKGTMITYKLPNGAIVTKALPSGATSEDISRLNREMMSVLSAIERSQNPH